MKFSEGDKVISIHGTKGIVVECYPKDGARREAYLVRRTEFAGGGMVISGERMKRYADIELSESDH